MSSFLLGSSYITRYSSAPLNFLTIFLIVVVAQCALLTSDSNRWKHPQPGQGRVMWSNYPTHIEQNQEQMPLHADTLKQSLVNHPYAEYNRQDLALSIDQPSFELPSLMSMISVSPIPMRSGQTSSLQGALDVPCNASAGHPHQSTGRPGEILPEPLLERHFHRIHVKVTV
jgi:hypothetical protein